MSVWKRNAVVVAIVLFVGAAVYLNWSYNNQSEETGDDPGKVLGQTSLVNGQQEEDGQTAQTGETGETGETAGEETNQTGYFASARLNRQQARDSALELLQEAAADASADQTLIDEANASIQAMATYTMSEAQAENLITAKGYGECVCFLNEDSASVVVASTDAGLTDSDTAKIVEIVMETTGLEANQIKIIEADP
ncbi:MAG TPA: SpoIIIAH-like family protein [Candidatus Enterenecus stercoripullorum]|nr:SpoIIIAH-like family protein [Candidatus Enterenecus stercoripullorum]